MKRDWNAMAQGILDAVGGPENISGMTHCATRLRLNLKDDAACDDAAVKEVEGVVNTLNKAGQYQVLIGTEVPKLYEKFEPLVKGSGVEISAATKDEGESIVSQIFSAISGIFAPLLPAMAGSGILRGFVILAAQLGIIAEGTGTYTILYTLAMSVFYFLPVLLVIGPLGVYAGEGIAFVVNWLIERSSLLAGVLVGGGWSVLVSMGIHWAVNPIMINNIAQNGFDYICPFTFACNFAVIGCAFGVFLKARDQKLKSFAMTGVVSIALSAIIEPTLFGMLVKNKKVWLAQIIGGAVGGAFLGIMKVVTTAFTFGSVTTFPAFVSSDPMNFAWAMAGMLISAVVAGVLAFIFTGKEDQLA